MTDYTPRELVEHAHAALAQIGDGDWTPQDQILVAVTAGLSTALAENKRLWDIIIDSAPDWEERADEIVERDSKIEKLCAENERLRWIIAGAVSAQKSMLAKAVQ